MDSTRQFYYNAEEYYDAFQIKKKNGTLRNICAPSRALLARQRTLLPGLNHQFEQHASRLGLQNVFHGFVKDRNCVTAASLHVGYDTTIIMDISNFFDTVTPGHMPLSPQLVEDILFTKGANPTLAQGFATSPILANIALLEIVKNIKTSIEAFVTSNYVMTIYADDIQISVKDLDYDALDIIKLIVQQELEQNGFQIHPHKTRITHSKYGYRKILGVMVGDNHIKPSRKLKKKIRAARHQASLLNSSTQPHAAASLGGLVTASRLQLPRALR